MTFKVFFSRGVTLTRSAAIHFDRRIQIFSHTPAKFQACPVVALSPRVPLLSGEPIPVRRLRIILRHAPAVVIQEAKIILSTGMSLFCGAAKTASRLRIILWFPLAELVGQSQIIERLSVFWYSAPSCIGLRKRSPPV